MLEKDLVTHVKDIPTGVHSAWLLVPGGPGVSRVLEIAYNQVDGLQTIVTVSGKQLLSIRSKE